MRSSATSGRSSQARSRRPPIGVTVRSISCEQRSLAAALHRLDDLEVLQRDRIDQQASADVLAAAIAADVREVGLLGVAQVARPARRRRRPRPGAAFEAEPVEAADAQLVEQRAAAPLSSSKSSRRRAVTGSRAAAISGSARRHVVAGGDDNLARPEHARSRRRSACRPVGAGVLGRRRTRRSRGRAARRRVHGRAFAPRRWRRDRHQERRLARVEVAGVGQRARRDDADDLALDEALGLLRILDLLADGDAKALLDQPRDVAVGRVVRARRTSGWPCRWQSFERDVSVRSSARAATSASS